MTGIPAYQRNDPSLKPSPSDWPALIWGALAGGALGAPASFFVPALLWQLEETINPPPPGGIEETVHSMSLMALMFFGWLFGLPLGAGIGAAIGALVRKRLRMAGALLLGTGMVGFGIAILFKASGPTFRDQFLPFLLPWRWGYLLYALLTLLAGIICLFRGSEAASRQD